MENGFLDNQFPGEKSFKVRRRVDPVPIYFDDEALPPDGHIETHKDDSAHKDNSDILQGLWPEATKNWFVWNEGEKSCAIRVAVDVEKLCDDYNIGRWWREKVKKFVYFKTAYDEKKSTGKYVDPAEDWPFDPDNPRPVNLPGDIPALYAILWRFHDWMIGFDEIICFDPAELEFLYDSSPPGFKKHCQQRAVRVEELEEFLEYVKKDLEANHVCQHLIEDEKRGTPDEGVLSGEHPESTEVKEDLGPKQKSKRKSKKEKIIAIATCLDNMKKPTSKEVSEITGIDESDVRHLWGNIKKRMSEDRVRKPKGYREKNDKIEAVDESATCKICQMPLKSSFECGLCKKIITGECQVCHFTNTHPEQAIP